MNLIVGIALAVVLPIPILLAGWTVHELSHWVTVRLLGMQVLKLRLGPFVHERGRWRWDIRREVQAGFVGYVRPDFERTSTDGLRARCIAVSASGPGGQLLSGVTVAVVALHWGSWPLWPSAVLVGLTALVELWPSSLGTGTPNGGATAGRYGAGSQPLLPPRTVPPAPHYSWRRPLAGSLATLTGTEWISPSPSNPPRRPRSPLGSWRSPAPSTRATWPVPGRSWTWSTLGASCCPQLNDSAPRRGPPSSRRAFARDVDRAAGILGSEADWSPSEWYAELTRTALDEATGRAADALARCDRLLIEELRSDGGFGAMLRGQLDALSADAAASMPASAPLDPGEVPTVSAAGAPIDQQEEAAET